MKRRRRAFIEGSKPPSPSSSSSSLSEYSTSSSSSSFTSSSSSSSSSEDEGSKKRKRSHHRSHKKEALITPDPADYSQPHAVPFPIPSNYLYGNPHFPSPSTHTLPPSHGTFRSAGKNIRSIVRPTHKKITYYDDQSAAISPNSSSKPQNMHYNSNFTPSSNSHTKANHTNSNNYSAYINNTHDLRANYNLYNSLHRYTYDIAREKSISTTSNNPKYPSTSSYTDSSPTGLAFSKVGHSANPNSNHIPSSAVSNAEYNSYLESINRNSHANAISAPLAINLSSDSNPYLNFTTTVPNNSNVNLRKSNTNNSFFYPNLDPTTNLSVKPEGNNAIPNLNVIEPVLETFNTKSNSNASNTARKFNPGSHDNGESDELRSFINQVSTQATSSFPAVNPPNVRYDPNLQYAVLRNAHNNALRQMQNLYSPLPTGNATRFAYLPMPSQGPVYPNVPTYPSYVVWRPAVPPGSIPPDNATSSNAAATENQFTDVSSDYDNSDYGSADEGSVSESENYEVATTTSEHSTGSRSADLQARAKLFSSPSPTSSLTISPCPSPSPTPELSSSPTCPASPPELTPDFHAHLCGAERTSSDHAPPSAPTNQLTTSKYAMKDQGSSVLTVSTSHDDTRVTTAIEVASPEFVHPYDNQVCCCSLLLCV
jgi:hypothetical protein